ncbi:MULTISPECIES: GIY-YIG nuclease family protein [Bacillus]|uniref:GIY-YIG nuclease family protein n=1 Tax=Bacillus TaxID=1386 RepID=UPI000D046620|nr:MULTISPECIES: GIY-YIG nuclease family protein [Bacillus]MBU8845722.1 GIY-YIG nuclease family protein [Alkalicoccobacillus gibsonii]MCF7615638.1 GIY-YIG nuclease family protein [Bacillus subtilis]MDD9768027.1 GIY-YIG nuclease family protein [Bacillus subtilis]MDD9771368.1 GIY-YIG nuclease family protein [Bacillus subtilis]MDD9775627.1 GIY-YIG nuclease family protein [Bacillus subtilis]
MDTEKLSNSMIRLFNENGNIPMNQYEALTATNILGRSARSGDYKYIAFICPGLKGFFNWHSHVRHGIKATVVKAGQAKIVYKEGLEVIDELVLKYYDSEVDVSAIEPPNSAYYAEQCINYVCKALIELQRSDLIKYIYSSEVISDEPENDDYGGLQWIYIFRHPKVRNELKIGMTTRPWQERYAEANMNTYTSRDLEVVATFPCKDGKAVERLIHSQFEEYRLPPKTGQTKQPEWFEFPEDKVDEVITRIEKFMKSIDLLAI